MSYGCPNSNARSVLAFAPEGAVGASVSPDAGSIEGPGSASGARADMTRSGGNVMITSVPMRSFD
jgi:hypothetical protein